MCADYLHGYDEREQERLTSQARFLEEKVYAAIDYPPHSHIIEIGCGTGAQIEILLRRFPTCHFTGVDYAAAQLEKASNRLRASIAEGRVTLKQMDATVLEFPPGTQFDGAFVCWMLEHAREPLKVLQELRSVLKPGAIAHITEVQNQTLYLHPEQPRTMEYWQKLNALQVSMGGDPYIGTKLGNLMQAAGFREITTQPNSFHFDGRDRAGRSAMLKYWTELLMSAAPQLAAVGRLEPGQAEAVVQQMEQAAENPESIFFYTFMQARGFA